jgi:hydroxymethylglutaryl-CoA lyase
MSYPKVEFTENVMREGMQIESVDIPSREKVRLLDSLSKTGLPHIVVGSFVSPRYTPQMARVEEVIEGFTPKPGVLYSGMYLNPRGKERAEAFMPPLEEPPDRVPHLFAHLCDTFQRRNTNRGQADEIARWPVIVEAARNAGVTEAGIGVGAAFGSNFEGEFTHEERMDLLRREHKAWDDAGIPVTTVSLADPMGWVKPWVVEQMLEAVQAEWPGVLHFGLHLHDSRGLGLASTYEALRVLDDRHSVHFDTTAGGIGGCPYCGNGQVTGMVATEDLVNMLHELGIETGVDIDRLVESVWILEEIIGRPANGHVSKAGPHPHGDRLYDANLPLIETAEQARHFLLGEEVTEGGLRPWKEPIPEPQHVV